MKSTANRIESIRKRLVETKEGQYVYAGQRLYPFWKAVDQAPNDWSLARKLAFGTKAVCGQSRPIVQEDELLVGYNYCPLTDDVSNLEGAGTFTILQSDHDRDALKGYLEKGELSPSEVDYVVERTVGTRFFPVQLAGEASVEESRYTGLERDGACVAWCISNNHSVLGYERVVQHGFQGLIDQLDARLEDSALTDDQRDELLAMRLYAEGGAVLGQRYADELSSLAESETDPARAAEYREMSEVCAQVPRYGARTFLEAVQSLWFAHILNTWEDMINANSVGRLDQILWPYYQADVAAGRITKDRAREILAFLWLKLYRDYDVQQVTLAGLTPDGKDASNELTWLCLDVTEQLRFVRCQSVRLSRQTPRALIRRALEVVGKNQNGVPFFFNDETLVPAQVEVGIPVEDARGYAPLGCIEITIPGKSNPHAVSNRVNLLKCLEYALNDGYSMLNPGERLGLPTGDASGFTYEQLMEAYRRQVEFVTRAACDRTNRCTKEVMTSMRMPYKSLLTDGCMEKATDFNAGGPTYDYFHSMPMGIPNVADSLTAIRELVFEKKRCTLSELIEQMKQNFPDEAFHMMLLRGAPKYGNDIEEVDALAGELTGSYCDLVKTIPSLYGLGFFAQPFTYLWMMSEGSNTAASPDGRRAREPLAYSVSPMQGRDFTGLTSVFKSLAQIPAARCPGSVSAIIEAEPILFTEENLDRLTDLMVSAVEIGVGQVQFNVVTAELLREAQKHPENHRNLAVRVSGFSQKFCLLDHALQDHIISRTKHATM